MDLTTNTSTHWCWDRPKTSSNSLADWLCTDPVF